MIPLYTGSFGPLSRLCPKCDVSTHENLCWICGDDINRNECKDRSEATVVNPGGPNENALDRALIL